MSRLLMGVKLYSNSYVFKDLRKYLIIFSHAKFEQKSYKQLFHSQYLIEHFSYKYEVQ